ncbi:hypothetical protein [Allonocardiopsis opalescens]|uniref:D-apionate lactonase C-terminal domain-containing protein n=1 Tax=Allonocardiopsis opalescens TaxID=1144618 RepID=A0A2T0QCK7_9ACTN|nr:hypothetical protein [Allonocardiopsis opalescens]PRY01638.1 hypothetical protein CLV72_101221 [Allonocardiopsis opalescens]
MPDAEQATGTEGAPTGVPITAEWDRPQSVSRTETTTHVWTAPQLRRGTPTHERAWAAVRELKADHARFLSWYSHPLLSVPALEPPADGRTSWDFTALDPFMDDFLAAAEGRPVVANLATIPTWMFETPEPVPYGTDPEEIQWGYQQGTEFRDPSLKEVADYFERFARWYIAGGFHDEYGTWHESGRRHRFAYWEVLCEPEIGHRLTPETYTRLYDEVVKRLRPLDPDMRFIGLSLSMAEHEPEFFWHFLDPAKHEDGVPLDAISYHLYTCTDIINPVGPEGNAPFDHWPGVFFAQADGYVNEVRHIEAVKRRLSPRTETHVNEIGTFNTDLMNPDPQVPDEYWALSGAVAAYLWSHLTEIGVHLVGIAEFMGSPGEIPGVSLVDWETGAPNARYWAAKLLIDHFGRGDTLVPTTAGSPELPDFRLHARGFVAPDGRRSLLLVNKSPQPVPVRLADAGWAGQAHMVDTTTGAEPARTVPVGADGSLELGPFATAVVTSA